MTKSEALELAQKRKKWVTWKTENGVHYQVSPTGEGKEVRTNTSDVTYEEAKKMPSGTPPGIKQLKPEQ